jgi:hypothetical protein
MCRSGSYSALKFDDDDIGRPLVDAEWLDVNPGGNMTVGSIYVECSTIVLA